jgi:hypothetical protein
MNTYHPIMYSFYAPVKECIIQCTSYYEQWLTFNINVVKITNHCQRINGCRFLDLLKQNNFQLWSAEKWC